MNFDHTHDRNGAELLRLSKLYTFPEFVKSASEENLHPGAALPPTAYGDPRNRTFPCHTAASTWLSNLYFAEKQAEYSARDVTEIKNRLLKAASFWQIRDDVNAVYSRWDELHKTADARMADSDFAVVIVRDDGTKERHCRMKTAMEVKAAAEWLLKHRDSIPYGDRNVIATKIVEKAAAYGATLGANELFIEKQAGRGVCDPADVVRMLSQRATLGKTAAYREAMHQLADTFAAKKITTDPATLVELAKTVEAYDRANHINYTAHIQRPEDVIFGVTFKEAKDGEGCAVRLTNGTVYNKMSFEKVSLADIKALFGPAFASEVTLDGLSVCPEKLAEQAAALPAPDADAFEQLLKEANVPHVATIVKRRALSPADAAAY